MEASANAPKKRLVRLSEAKLTSTDGDGDGEDEEEEDSLGETGHRDSDSGMS